MTDVERSRLIYLLDALDRAPERHLELIKIVERKEETQQYKAYLQKLRNAKDVSLTAKDIREELR